MTDVRQDSVTVEVVVTLDDQVRYSELLLSEPDLRRLYYRRWAVAILLMPPVGLVVGILIGFVADHSPPSLQDLFETFWADRVSILYTWLIIALLMVALMIVFRLLRHRQLRAQSRMLLRERHGIDRNDPDLSERARCTFGPDGFRSLGEGGEYHARWSAVSGLDETPELLVLRTGRFTGFVLPRRELSEEEVAAIRRIVAANCGVPHTGPWS